MSVINQMLKDLDKRQGEQTADSNVVIPESAKNASINILVIAVIVIIVANVVGIVIWQLYAENQALKSQAQQSSVEVGQMNFDSAVAEINSSKNIDVEKTIATKDIEKAAPGTRLAEALESTLPKSIVTSEVKPEPKSAQAEQLVANNTPLATVNIKPESPSSDQHTRNVIEPQSTEASAQAIAAESRTKSHKPTLTISRSQLSPKALAEKKMAEAERAMEVNDLANAASLFEEVLLLIPEHETARKRLAALWYGKKAYQDAINLLSQGIALTPPAEEMRLMAARIYFEQGQARQALNLLSPVNNSERTELQVLLASLATELNEHKIASAAYQQLLRLQPDISRWWLGLAISLDSQGQFNSASDAYNQAIAKGNLSIDALRFSRQRLAELGE